MWGARRGYKRNILMPLSSDLFRKLFYIRPIFFRNMKDRQVLRKMTSSKEFHCSWEFSWCFFVVIEGILVRWPQQLFWKAPEFSVLVYFIVYKVHCSRYIKANSIRLKYNYSIINPLGTEQARHLKDTNNNNTIWPELGLRSLREVLFLSGLYLMNRNKYLLESWNFDRLCIVFLHHNRTRDFFECCLLFLTVSDLVKLD